MTPPPPLPTNPSESLHLALVDFNDGTPTSSETTELSRLLPGSPPILYDHTGKKTKFSMWLAIKRGRLERNFKYDNKVRNILEDGTMVVTDQTLPPDQYWIWVEAAKDSPA